MGTVTDSTPPADWLSGRSAAQLARILQLRRDALWGVPLRGLGDLADRLCLPASVGQAVMELPLPGLELLHALTALGPSPTVTAAGAF